MSCAHYIPDDDLSCLLPTRAFTCLLPHLRLPSTRPGSVVLILTNPYFELFPNNANLVSPCIQYELQDDP